jgi:hypothetical protein
MNQLDFSSKKGEFCMPVIFFWPGFFSLQIPVCSAYLPGLYLISKPHFLGMSIDTGMLTYNFLLLYQIMYYFHMLQGFVPDVTLIF